ncbi:MAG: ribonuclease [Rhizobiaceae bacterium]
MRSILLIGILLFFHGCNDGAKSTIPQPADVILAISWQAAFCETHSRKKECQSQTSSRYDATHFALHGLWPQPRSKSYCGTSEADIQHDKRGKWLKILQLELSKDLRANLRLIMPGYQSGLQRHEWIKHGSCYSDTPEKYFTDSLVLMEKLNGSPLRELFAGNIGKHITTKQIRAAMDEGFGAGSGLRVRVKCSNDSGRRLISELTLALAGEVGDDVGKLLLSALPDDKKSCPGGIIDPVGQQ